MPIFMRGGDSPFFEALWKARDPGSQIGELALDVLIAALDMVRPVNRRLAVRGQRGEE
jgi:hypothetical protein